MNYRHSYHAGGFADVLKHSVLALIIQHLLKKDAAFRYIDTHAGLGRYDLRAADANKTGEWRDGIGRIWQAELPSPVASLLAPWRQAVEALNGDGELRFYPGSPEIVRAHARAQDRLTLCELHPEDVARLKGHYARDARVSVVNLDGYTAAKAYVPPKERRGLVLIDPPFEEDGEWRRMADTLQTAHGKWPGTYALWYPIKDVMESDAFARTLGKLGIPSIISAELFIQKPNDKARLNGCGLAIVNPPWTLEKDLTVLLPALADHLGRGEGARGRTVQIAGEA